ncbi:MAG: hypothetical protein ACPL1F_01440 [bacterium]
MSCCKKVKEYLNNYQNLKTNSDLLKFLALFVYHKEFSIEAYIMLKDHPELYQALIFEPIINQYFKRIFYSYFKKYIINFYPLFKLNNLYLKRMDLKVYDIRITN